MDTLLAAANPVQWLFLDLNAFFASCEQQEAPALRGKPVIVVQTLTDSACAIAASYAAKGLRYQAPAPRADRSRPVRTLRCRRIRAYLSTH
jgi:DNA polymerase-4